MVEPADTATPLAFWERWRAYVGQTHDPSFSRLRFSWVADWAFLPLSMDIQQYATAHGAIQRVGLSDALHALLEKIPAPDPLLEDDIVKEWRTLQRRIGKEPSPGRRDFISWTSVNERILRSLFQGFLSQVEAPAHPRHAALNALRHYDTTKPLPTDVRRRVNEVVFLGAFIVRWGHVCMRHWTLRAQQAQPLRTQLHEMQELLAHVQRAPLYSTEMKARMQAEVEAVRQFLDALLAPEQAVNAWRKELLAFDKRLHVDSAKCGIWSDVFWELGQLLRDYVKGRKHSSQVSRAYEVRFVPDDTFKAASTLVSLAYPILWPNKWAKAKSRYRKRADAQQAEG